MCSFRIITNVRLTLLLRKDIADYGTGNTGANLAQWLRHWASNWKTVNISPFSGMKPVSDFGLDQ